MYLRMKETLSVSFKITTIHLQPLWTAQAMWEINLLSASSCQFESSGTSISDLRLICAFAECTSSFRTMPLTTISSKSLRAIYLPNNWRLYTVSDISTTSIVPPDVAALRTRSHSKKTSTRFATDIFGFWQDHLNSLTEVYKCGQVWILTIFLQKIKNYISF